jgi:hypothetical protein
MAFSGVDVALARVALAGAALARVLPGVLPRFAPGVMSSVLSSVVFQTMASAVVPYRPLKRALH